MEKLLPQLRFPEFESSLTALKLDDVVTFKSGGTPPKENESYWNGDIPWISAASMQGKYYSKSDRTITEEGLKKGSKLAIKGSLLILVRGSMLFNKIPLGITERDVAFNQDLKSLLVNNRSNTEYLYQWFSSKENLILDKVGGTGIGAGKLDTDDLKNLKLYLPSLPEQTKIATFLTAVDEKLTALKQKKTLLEQYKKGVMQKIFSQQMRFKDDDGNDFPDWEEKKLGDCLEYLQPTKYLVSSTEYNNSYKTPVLTAGKTFILGYTNESNGIFETNLPVIIFDDFTTATQFVDFPFKAKSSAMKILRVKVGANIKFMYETMRIMKYELGGHERHWISKFAPMDILIPSLPEQTKIANFLAAIDKKINHCQGQIEKAGIWKKGLLQQLFV
jgi:type I restriction enzyme S subunit